VFIVVHVYFVIDSVRKLLDTPSYAHNRSRKVCSMDYAYFRNPLFANFQTSLVLMVICSRYKSVTAESTRYKGEHTTDITPLGQ